MSNRSAVIAAIVGWLARGASPIDGMYAFQVPREGRGDQADAPAASRTSAPAASNIRGACRA